MFGLLVLILTLWLLYLALKIPFKKFTLAEFAVNSWAERKAILPKGIDKTIDLHGLTENNSGSSPDNNERSVATILRQTKKDSPLTSDGHTC